MLLLAVWPSSTAWAELGNVGGDDGGGSSGGDAGGDVERAIFTAWANSYDINANYPNSYRRVCKYRPIRKVDTYSRATPWGQWTWTTVTGIVVLTWWRNCDTNDDGVIDGEELEDEYYAQFVIVDTDILLEVLTDRQSRTIDVPTPDLSPPDQGYINLGLWLAVDDVDIPDASAASGANRARVWVEMDSTTYEFGNGDSVTCEGPGTPIPEHMKDSIEQGPCGYVYSDRKGEYQITVTAGWSDWAETNTLAPFVVDTVSQSTTIAYPVLEIQTVGKG